MTKLPSFVLAALALACCGASAQNANQGVSKNEIVLGSIQDLSGPIAGFGKQVRLGMILRVDEINEQGGINGRKIKLVVEDSAYDPKKAVLAALADGDSPTGTVAARLHDMSRATMQSALRERRPIPHHEVCGGAALAARSRSTRSVTSRAIATDPRTLPPESRTSAKVISM